MNKILLAKDKIKIKDIDQTIKLKEIPNPKFKEVYTVKIKVIEDTDLEINYDKQVKCDIYVDILPNIKLNIYELKQSGEYKISHHYELKEKSELNVYSINENNSIKESINIDLNGADASVKHIIKTISLEKENYDIAVNHNAPNTKSMIINHGVSNKGEINFNVSGIVPKGIKKCTLNQDNRIINLNDNKNQIKPNLFIDENDCLANHSAHIGKCNENEMFYLMSRGITSKEAKKLIIQGFLLKQIGNYKDKMIEIINRHWR